MARSGRFNVSKSLAVLTLFGGLVSSGCSGSGSGPNPQDEQGAQSPAPKSSADAYSSPDGYSITPPKGWATHPIGSKGTSVVFGAPESAPSRSGPFLDNINIFISPNQDSLDAVIARAKEESPKYLANYKVIGEIGTALPSGQPAHEIGGTYDDETSGPLENLQLIVIDSGKEYTVTYTATRDSFADHVDDVQSSFRTFELH